jgi:hypothetical protein
MAEGDAAPPRIEDVPLEDREAVERALALYRDRVHELEAQVAALAPVAAELRQELRALRTGLGSTAHFELDEEDWPAENGSDPAHRSWAGPALPPPLPRPVIVPRLVLEAAFLALAAAVAALAELEPVWIVAVMAGAWALVALSEWAAYAKQHRWRLDEVAPLLEEQGSPAWYVPPVERTALEPPDRSESHTVVASLPAAETGELPVVDATESDPDDEPPRRPRFWRRGRSEPEVTGDPWEV